MIDLAFFYVSSGRKVSSGPTDKCQVEQRLGGCGSLSATPIDLGTGNIPFFFHFPLLYFCLHSCLIRQATVPARRRTPAHRQTLQKSWTEKFRSVSTQTMAVVKISDLIIGQQRPTSGQDGRPCWPNLVGGGGPKSEPCRRSLLLSSGDVTIPSARLR